MDVSGGAARKSNRQTNKSAERHPRSLPLSSQKTTHHVPHSTSPPQPLGSVEHSAPLVQLALGTHAAATHALLLALGTVPLAQRVHAAAPSGACGATEPAGHFVHTFGEALVLPPFFFVAALVVLRTT